MKKITSILALFLMCFGISLQAAVTDLPEMSTATGIKWYALKNTRSHKFATFIGDDQKMVQTSQLSSLSAFKFVGAAESAKLINAFNGKALADFNSWSADGSALTVKANGTNGLNITFVGREGHNSLNDEGSKTVGPYFADDGGSYWEVVALDASKVAEMKTALTAQLKTVETLPALYGDVAAVLNKVNAVEETDFNAALAALNKIVSDFYTRVNGVGLLLDVQDLNQNSSRWNMSLGLDLGNNCAAGSKGSDDDKLWFVNQYLDGTFSLYNIFADRYLGQAGFGPNKKDNPETEDRDESKERENWTMLTDRNAAALYRFETVTNSPAEGDKLPENVVALVSNGAMLHMLNTQGLPVGTYNNISDGASQWKMTPRGVCQVERDFYVNAEIASAALPFELQRAYGLAKKAENYVCPYPETASAEHSSYENLIDGNPNTYFHSSWSDATAQDKVHEITVDLGQAVSSFSFFMKQRGNGAHRPINITLEGSADGQTFEKIEDYVTPLETETEFLSAPFTPAKACRYVRFNVTKTTTANHPYFAIAELYVFGDVKAVADVYNKKMAFDKLSIVDADYTVQANEILNLSTDMLLANAKSQANAQLSASSVVADGTTPALNQYFKADYDKAVKAVADATTVDAVYKAMSTFRKSVNAPVFVISTAIDGQYFSGMAACWKGAWKFAAKDNYNPEMWFKAVGAAENVVKSGTEYEFVNLVSGSNILYDGTAIPQAVNGAEGVFNLKVNTGNNFIHAQNDFRDLVTWYAYDGTQNAASAWKFEYVGNSYELEKEIAKYNPVNQLLYKAKSMLSVPAGAVDYCAYFDDASQKAQFIEAVKTLESKRLDADARKALENLVATAENAGKVVFDANKYYRVQSVTRGLMMEWNAKLKSNVADLAKVDQIWKFNEVSTKDGYEVIIINLENNCLALENESGKSTKFQWTKLNEGQYALEWNKSGFVYATNSGAKDLALKTLPYADSDMAWYLLPATELEVNMNKVSETAKETWASLYLPFGVQLKGDLKAYAGKISGNVMNLSAVEAVPAKYGVILSGAADKYALTIDNAAATSVENELQGTNVQMEKVANAVVLGNVNGQVGLYAPKGENLLANKAYAVVSAAAAANGLKFVFGETTGVEGVEVATENAVYYDLSGRRVVNPVKGIYVVNGKKVYVK